MSHTTQIKTYFLKINKVEQSLNLLRIIPRKLFCILFFFDGLYFWNNINY